MSSFSAFHSDGKVNLPMDVAREISKYNDQTSVIEKLKAENEEYVAEMARLRDIAQVNERRCEFLEQAYEMEDMFWDETHRTYDWAPALIGDAADFIILKRDIDNKNAKLLAGFERIQQAVEQSKAEYEQAVEQSKAEYEQAVEQSKAEYEQKKADIEWEVQELLDSLTLGP